jgi:hypothetical protein
LFVVYCVTSSVPEAIHGSCPCHPPQARFQNMKCGDAVAY